MSVTERNDQSCPTCGERIGDHTVDGLADCFDGLNYTLPHEDIPDGPLRFAGVDGEMVGEVTISSAFVDAPIGRFPAIKFQFFGTGTNPMEHRPLPPITLVMDARGLRSVRQLVSASIDRAIVAARRGR